ncbi:hypothetical protein WN943_023028 [Citrus x changshan-huyou]
MSLFIAAATANTSSITTDQDALLALKAHMSHDPTNFFAKKWNTSIPVCNWTGVACDIHSRRVTVLNISGLNLTGTIPSQLWNLSSLESLDLSFNRLPGSIPSAIFTTYTLKYVSFRGNQLSGAFPLSSSTNLSYNDFSGAIPKEVGNLTKLKELYLGHKLDSKEKFLESLAILPNWS